MATSLSPVHFTALALTAFMADPVLAHDLEILVLARRAGVHHGRPAGSLRSTDVRAGQFAAGRRGATVTLERCTRPATPAPVARAAARLCSAQPWAAGGHHG